MSIEVIVRSGFNVADHSIGTVQLRPQSIQSASGLFGSNYILHMGLHYQRYVVSGYLPHSPVVHDIYHAVNPAPRLTTKKRATSVTGNIGECVLGIVARRKLGASGVLDVLPLNVDSRAKCPDFRVRINPVFPPSFRTATGLNPAVGFSHWPAESKAVESSAKATQIVAKALVQLGAYWYERRHLEATISGYGIVCCFIYKGTKATPLQVIRLYVFAPTNQAALLQRIDHFRLINNRAGFLTELSTAGSASRGALKDG